MIDRSPVWRIALGFAAGALAVATFHQILLVVLVAAGLVQGTAYSFSPVPPFGVPHVLSAMFWGGVWGIVFALIVERIPGRAMWVKGLIFSIAPLLVVWFVVAALRGQPLMGGLDPARMFVGVVLQAVFGIGTAWLYALACRQLVPAKA